MLHTLSTPDYRPALSLLSVTAEFSERLSTFTSSYQESCSLYPRCTPYFSVEHAVSLRHVQLQSTTHLMGAVWSTPSAT